MQCWPERSQEAIAAQFALTIDSMDRLSQTAIRLAMARNPPDFLVAQAELWLTLVDVATTPVRAWLDVAPNLNASLISLKGEISDDAVLRRRADAERSSTQSLTSSVPDIFPDPVERANATSAAVTNE